MATIASAAANHEIAASEGGAAVPSTRRIETLDFVRGVALFGILLMNITAFGLPDSYSNPTNAGGATGLNLWAWIIMMVGFEGTQRALFSMLFGASVILFTSRLEAAGRADVADIYMRRNLWLIGFGLVNAFVFLWYGDILYAYGVVALFVFVFRKLAAKHLLAIGIGTLILGALWNMHETSTLLGKHQAYVEAVAARTPGGSLNPAQQEAVSAWEEARSDFKSSPEDIRSSIDAHVSGYGPAFRHIGSINAYWQSWGMYRYFFDIFGMVLIGMALFRMGVLTLERPTRLYLAMLIAGYGVGIAVNVAETRWIMAHQFSAISFAQANITYDLGRLAMTIGHLGALLLFARSGALSWLRRALAAVGQMAVTNYLTHSVVCGIIFIGLGYYGQLQRYQLYYVVFAIWAVQLVLSPIWLRHFRFGPVEWLWRALTYMQKPPFRREASPVAA